MAISHTVGSIYASHANDQVQFHSQAWWERWVGAVTPLTSNTNLLNNETSEITLASVRPLSSGSPPRWPDFQTTTPFSCDHPHLHWPEGEAPEAVALSRLVRACAGADSDGPKRSQLWGGGGLGHMSSSPLRAAWGQVTCSNNGFEVMEGSKCGRIISGSKNMVAKTWRRQGHNGSKDLTTVRT